MGDELDPCACIWTPDFSMLRLLSIVSTKYLLGEKSPQFTNYNYLKLQLRQSQAYCTDTECLTDGCKYLRGHFIQKSHANKILQHMTFENIWLKLQF